jgi:hypothetical protein
MILDKLAGTIGIELIRVVNPTYRVPADICVYSRLGHFSPRASIALKVCAVLYASLKKKWLFSKVRQ